VHGLWRLFLAAHPALIPSESTRLASAADDLARRRMAAATLDDEAPAAGLSTADSEKVKWWKKQSMTGLSDICGGQKEAYGFVFERAFRNSSS
jgi:hypothetical protein